MDTKSQKTPLGLIRIWIDGFNGILDVTIYRYVSRSHYFNIAPRPAWTIIAGIKNFQDSRMSYAICSLTMQFGHMGIFVAKLYSQVCMQEYIK